MLKISVTLVVMSLCAPAAYPEIISGSNTVTDNSDLSLEAREVTANRIVGYGPTGKVYPCTSRVHQVDLFYAFYRMGLCTHYCIEKRLGSPRPFWVSNKPLSDILLASPLDLKDTLTFTPVDTFKIPGECQLPCVSAIPNAGSGFLVVKTRYGRYAIVVCTPEHTTTCTNSVPQPPVCVTHIDTIAVQWFVQENGSLDFAGVMAVSKRLIREQEIRVPSFENRAATENLYTLRGQRFADRTGRQCGILVSRTGRLITENLISRSAKRRGGRSGDK